MEQSENTDTFNEEEQQPELDPVAQAETDAFLDQEDYQEQVDDMENNADVAESVEWSEIPEKKKQESLYNLFQKVWKAPDSSKVANLTNVECFIFILQNLFYLRPWLLMALNNYLAPMPYPYQPQSFVAWLDQTP